MVWPIRPRRALADCTVRCISHPVLFESPDNDVPHTQAGLREVLKNLVKHEPDLRGKVRRVELWSDGGQAHFKCADGYRQGVHLQEWARRLLGPSCVLRWNFFQSYHGKGPYDAEGGIIKYLLRRQQRRQGRAFTSALEAYTWLVSYMDSSTKGAAAHAHVREYTINTRLPGLVLEEHMPTAPVSDYTVGAAHAADPCTAGVLKKKRDIFCLEFGDWPAIEATELGEHFYGALAGPHTDPAELAGPFSTVALHAMPDVVFGGRWRKLTCDCVACMIHDSTRLCTSQGAWSPAPWVDWAVKGAPSKAAATAWVHKELGNLIEDTVHMGPSAQQAGLDYFREAAVKKLIEEWHIYVSEHHCRNFVSAIIDKRRNK